MKYDIFISYKRRGTSSATAAYLYELLLNKGYSVFFDRKELRSGMFDEQLLTHISDAKDIIILLEETSLAACYNTDFPEYYLSDWFCKEVMHALSLPGKNVVPILLEGYKMPPHEELPEELKDLTRCQALNLEISEIEEFYEKYLVDKEYLKSKPTNISQIKRNRSNKAAISNLLFTYDGYCYDIFEYGDYIGTVDENNDDNHPYKYGVDFAGEHRILCINNDTCERIVINTEVSPYYQKYINIEWEKHQLIWELTETDINKEEDPKILFDWGKDLFEGTRTHKPNYELSILCLERAIEKHSSEASEYIKSSWNIVVEKSQKSKGPLIYPDSWVENAAKLGVVIAMRMQGMMHMKMGDYKTAKRWYKEAIKKGDVLSMLDVATYYSKAPKKPFTLEDITGGLAKDLPNLLLKIKDLANGEELFKLSRLCARSKWRKLPFSYWELMKLSASKGYGKACIMLGHKCETRGDYEGAIAQYNKAINESSRIDALFNIANCQLWLKRYEEAKHNYEIVINEASYDNFEESMPLMNAYIGLAKIYRDGLVGEQNVNKALKMYEQISQDNSWDGEYEIGLANKAILYETQPELDTQKAAHYYEELSKRLNDDTDYYLDFYGGFDAPHVDVCFAIAHASTNGISWNKDYIKALRYYAICVCDYSFTHNKVEILNIVNNDIRFLLDNIDYGRTECLRNAGFIYYELFEDCQKAIDLLKMAEEKEDENATDILRLIKIEENGKKKDEKRLRYYQSKSKNTYRGIKDYDILDYFIFPYGKNLFCDNESNIKITE